MKIKTIWHYAFCFFESIWDLQDASSDVDDIVYAGEIYLLNYEDAAKVAQIHPNFQKYYDAAMMPLFQGKGKLLSGTECPIKAIESYKTKSESEKDMPYILIWKAFKV